MGQDEFVQDKMNCVFKHHILGSISSVQLGLSGLTYGCRAAAYQLLNILAKLETAEAVAKGQLLESIRNGDRDTEMLRRLLVDFLDPDGYDQNESSSQSDYDDQVGARVNVFFLILLLSLAGWRS